ncbi:hypothetical protein [Pseudoduganella lutea]|uniref:Uncharacterized protein n=1 Tax=Pseudoduganella lutea TaxID=321985 RepID=A0A4P6KUS2_9BURK|nr:hypothetical protein [Pseudoduganella lutea]QBE61858.1 hypothetical protein EWM63_01645 [Pseudoduganella lutea]
MKDHPQDPRASSVSFDTDGTVPADFPPSDDVLDLLEGATDRADPDADAALLAVEHIHNLHMERFTQCRDLAERLCDIVQARASVPATWKAQANLLTWYRNSLVSSGWTSVEEAYWVTHRMALWLGWTGMTCASRH